MTRLAEEVKLKGFLLVLPQFLKEIGRAGNPVSAKQRVDQYEQPRNCAHVKPAVTTYDSRRRKASAFVVV